MNTNQEFIIKPSINQYFPLLILLPTFNFSIVFLSILLFDKKVNFQTPIIIFSITLILSLLAILPYLLFEKITINEKVLTHKLLFNKITMPISEIVIIEEVLAYKGRFQMRIKSKRKEIRIVYKTYPRESIKVLIQKIVALNPSVINDFDAI